MKTNTTKQILADGGVPVGHMLMDFVAPGIAQMLDRAGLDFVLIDMEHSAFTSRDVASLIGWLHATEIAPFVRVPQPQYHFIARSLDAGALGVMIPNVKTGAQAKAIVDAAKYAPLGQRGVALGGALTGYRGVDPAEFMDFSNRNTTVICQIESEEGLANLEDIAGTEGVDCLWVGHFDLTQSMGIPGQFESQRFQDALGRVAGTCRKFGLAAGIQPGSPQQAAEWMAAGFNLISYSSDHSVYRSALTAGVEQIRQQAGGGK